jgi:hypothetical protein
MLEFFRRGATADPAAPSRELEPTTRMLVLRRSQAVVAGAAAVAALLLAFLVGHAVGAGGRTDEAVLAVPVYVIRAAEYGDDEKGKGFARTRKEQLDKMGLGKEVSILEVPSESRTVVAVGSWLSDPEGQKDAVALREKLRGIKDNTQGTPFAGAAFWRMKR